MTPQRPLSPKNKKSILPRDLSWIYFNHRLLQEARRENVPLLERLSFLGIYSNNLDEFFRVRVSSLHRVIQFEPAGSAARAEAIHGIRTIERLTGRYLSEFEEAFEQIKVQLAAEGLRLIDEAQLSETQTQYIRQVYRNDLNSATYPLITSRGAHLPYLTDSGIYLAVRLIRDKRPAQGNKVDFALIELPTRAFGRFLVLPGEMGRTDILFLDDAVRFCLPYIFAGLGYDRFEAYTFKFTRDAEIELDSEVGEKLVDKIARGVRKRRKGEPVRFVYDKRMPADLLRHIRGILRVDRYDTSAAGSRYHNMKDLISFPTGSRTDLRFRPQPPLLTPLFRPYASTLEIIRQRDHMLHYPYHSFSTFIRILREAALSPDVTEIKTTVYRLAKDSKVVEALICAARHGKRVTVMVELMARFDESSNIDWSKKMQAEGIEVLFGIEQLKVHAKLTHITARGGNVACISSGNFHEENAKVYTDVTLCTADPAIAAEVERVFAYIRKSDEPMHFEHLLVAPAGLRSGIEALFDELIARARAGEPTYLLGKINHITDERLIGKLYEASAAGVQIRLLVRGNCSVVTGIKGLSERIEIRGIIDRYLEHSRILIFGAGEKEHYYIGSADWMSRNLDRRIEVYAPVYDPLMREQLRRILEYGLRDNQAARVVDGSGENRFYTDAGEPFRSQERLYDYYRNESEENPR